MRGGRLSQVLQHGVLRAPQQGQQVQGRDTGHVASADLQHTHQALRHGGSKAFHLQREGGGRGEADGAEQLHRLREGAEAESGGRTRAAPPITAWPLSTARGARRFPGLRLTDPSHALQGATDDDRPPEETALAGLGAVGEVARGRRAGIRTRASSNRGPGGRRERGRHSQAWKRAVNRVALTGTGRCHQHSSFIRAFEGRGPAATWGGVRQGGPLCPPAWRQRVRQRGRHVSAW